MTYIILHFYGNLAIKVNYVYCLSVCSICIQFNLIIITNLKKIYFIVEYLYKNLNVI